MLLNLGPLKVLEKQLQSDRNILYNFFAKIIRFSINFARILEK